MMNRKLLFWFAVIGVLLGFGFLVSKRLCAQGERLLGNRGPVLVHQSRGKRQRLAQRLLPRLAAGDRGRGYYQISESRHKRAIEDFSYEVDAQNIQFTFPNDNSRASSAYRVERVTPKRSGVDLKLTVARDPRNSGKTSVFYASSKWDDSIEDLVPPLEPAEP